jgi:predicted O-methyltransferase YrrM
MLNRRNNTQNALKRVIKRLLKRLPYCGKVIREREQVMHPPGHFYSPYPSIEEIKLKDKEIFESFPREIPGIDLNESEQLALFNELKRYYKELSFVKTEGLRYFFKKGDVGSPYSPDWLILYCMIRHLKSRRIIEIGSGKSSSVILDTNELFFDNSISCTFIDPYPKKLLSVLKKGDLDRIEVISEKLQYVELSKFSELSAGDILFIDSTHVSKVNSDVNYIFFDILPHLNQGVYIHFHDIFYPFEYPRKWVYSGMAWNEDYILRAFLQYNNAFKIMFFSNFLFRFYEDKLRDGMPFMKNGMGSCWLKKI